MPTTKTRPRIVINGDEFKAPYWIVHGIEEGQGLFESLPLAIACAEDWADEKGQQVVVVDSPGRRGKNIIKVNPKEVAK